MSISGLSVAPELYSRVLYNLFFPPGYSYLSASLSYLSKLSAICTAASFETNSQSICEYLSSANLIESIALEYTETPIGDAESTVFAKGTLKKPNGNLLTFLNLTSFSSIFHLSTAVISTCVPNISGFELTNAIFSIVKVSSSIISLSNLV